MPKYRIEYVKETWKYEQTFRGDYNTAPEYDAECIDEDDDVYETFAYDIGDAFTRFKDWANEESVCPDDDTEYHFRVKAIYEDGIS
jgi:hypothetical protein